MIDGEESKAIKEKRRKMEDRREEKGKNEKLGEFMI